MFSGYEHRRPGGQTERRDVEAFVGERDPLQPGKGGRFNAAAEGGSAEGGSAEAGVIDRRHQHVGSCTRAWLPVFINGSGSNGTRVRTTEPPKGDLESAAPADWVKPGAGGLNQRRGRQRQEINGVVHHGQPVGEGTPERHAWRGGRAGSAEGQASSKPSENSRIVLS